MFLNYILILLMPLLKDDKFITLQWNEKFFIEYKMAFAHSNKEISIE